VLLDDSFSECRRDDDKDEDDEDDTYKKWAKLDRHGVVRVVDNDGDDREADRRRMEFVVGELAGEG
jgi:hypothetical protein